MNEDTAALRRRTTILLLIGLGLALISPVCVALRRPSSAFYVLQPMVFLLGSIPYVVCAAIWLPRRSAPAARFGRGLSFALLAATVIVRLPQWLDPDTMGGDMVGLWYLVEVFFATAAVLVLSAIGAVVVRQSTQKTSL
jgi:hypothetical protein